MSKFFSHKYADFYYTFARDAICWKHGIFEPKYFFKVIREVSATYYYRNSWQSTVQIGPPIWNLYMTWVFFIPNIYEISEKILMSKEASRCNTQGILQKEKDFTAESQISITFLKVLVWVLIWSGRIQTFFRIHNFVTKFKTRFIKMVSQVRGSG